MKNILLLIFIFFQLSSSFIFPKINTLNIIKKNKELFNRNITFFSELVNKEETISIKHNNKLFNKLSGSFFAQIGSNPKFYENNKVNIFDGDGMIYGLFFNDSDLTYSNKWIETSKLKTENKYNKKIYMQFGDLKGIKNFIKIMWITFLQYIKIIPKVQGTANTALLKWNNSIYALNEADMPYKLNIDYINKNIETEKRIEIDNIYSTTAHPIKDNDKLHLFGYNNYNFKKGKYIHNIIDESFNLISQKNVSLLNNGMIHDVGFTENTIIIPDMPLKFNLHRIFENKFPLYFDKINGINRFGIFNLSNNDNIKWYYFDKNFYIFHFSNIIKKVSGYDIYACVMDDIFMEDFVSKQNNIIRGNTRLKKITIDTKLNVTKVIENRYIENLEVDFKYNIDFPVKSIIDKNKSYFCIFDSITSKIKGYMYINLLKFEKMKPKIFLFHNNTYGNSEPQVVLINKKEYLLTFTHTYNKSFISLIDIKSNQIENIEIPLHVPCAFHSIFFKH